MATENGVSWRVGDEPLRTVLHDSAVQQSLARDLAPDGEHVLVATPGGIVQLTFSGETVTTDLLHRVDALSLHRGSDGTLWVGGAGFVRRVRNGVLGPPLQGIHTTVRVNDILEDADGRVWLATNAGVFRAVGAGFRPFDHPALESERARIVNAGTLAGDGSIWFATWGGAPSGTYSGCSRSSRSRWRAQTS